MSIAKNKETGGARVHIVDEQRNEGMYVQVNNAYIRRRQEMIMVMMLNILGGSS